LTAVSSTNESDFSSPFIAIDRPSEAFAESPDPRLVRRRDEAAIDAFERLQITLDRLEPRRQILGAIGVQLHIEQRPWVVGLQDGAAASDPSPGFRVRGSG
jgi:hypothetical protein